MIGRDLSGFARHIRVAGVEGIIMMKHRTGARVLHAIASAFLLTTSLTAANVIAAQVAVAQSNQDYAEQFFAAGYTFCDAEKLGYFWGISQYDAKVQAGYKIWVGDQAVLDQVLAQAISQFHCPNNAFNMDDATKLAELWSAPAAS